MTWTSDYGAQSVMSKRPLCIRTERARTHSLLCSILHVSSFCVDLCEHGRQCAYKRNIQAGSCNSCHHGKPISITCSECVCVCIALVIQHAKRMCRVVWSSVTSAAVLYFSTFINTTIFGKMLLNIKCVFIFCATLEHFSFWEEMS